MTGNIAIGLAVLAPAGMLGELADGLNVGVHDAGLLVTWGALVLCIGSPVMAWLTTRIDRRLLLVAEENQHERNVDVGEIRQVAERRAVAAHGARAARNQRVEAFFRHLPSHAAVALFLDAIG